MKDSEYHQKELYDLNKIPDKVLIAEQRKTISGLTQKLAAAEEYIAEQKIEFEKLIRLSPEEKIELKKDSYIAALAKEKTVNNKLIHSLKHQSEIYLTKLLQYEKNSTKSNP